MNNQRGTGDKSNDMIITVAIDKDKGSQYALKWAVDHLLGKGKSVTLLHVKQKSSSASPHDDIGKPFKGQVENQAKELFLPFRCFCTRKDIQVSEVVCEDTDVVRGICDYVKANLVDILVLGAPSRNAFVRNFKPTDVATNVIRVAPDFCTVYVIAKGKISQTRSATTSIPNIASRGQTQNQMAPQSPMQASNPRAADRFAPRNLSDDMEIKSPFTRLNRPGPKPFAEFGAPDSDISFVSSGRPSPERPFPSSPDDVGFAPSRHSRSSETESRLSFGSPFSSGSRPGESNNSYGCNNSNSQESGGFSWSSTQNMEEVEAEMRRLKQELKQTMDMYSTACKEALTAKQKAMELHRWKIDEQRKLEEARLAEEAALAIAEREKEKCKAAIQAAEASQRIAEMEAQKRITAEMKALKEAEEKKKALDTLATNDVRYRKYSIDEIETATEYFAQTRKIGEGGYGPVYKCYLDHTEVAVKVLRPDAAQGRSQFQQEVEVLSCIRHPNMVLLLGACPEYGCLVYEYMANGSLEDRLLRRGNTPALSWQLRFRIAAEIGTALLFLHQTKPEPLVHRDLKPGNILLDRNYVSKISDVGLARLVPPSVADAVTQYRMTSTAGTFCYIDPEYQQTGMLGIKSDVYSLGVMLLQVITAKPPMGLTHHVERAMERGTFADMLDPAVTDWPVDAAMQFAKIALKCAEMRRKDRPDLGTVVLPELNKLRELAEESTTSFIGGGFSGGSSNLSHTSSMSSVQTGDSQVRNSGFQSALNRRSAIN